MRDVDISPDGSYFVVSTTGAYGGAGDACDSTARWEIERQRQRPEPDVDQQHRRRHDVRRGDHRLGRLHRRPRPLAEQPVLRRQPGQGAVSRPGIAALDPINGLPLSWNPTRDRGIGVFDLLHTAEGLWVGSDTDRIGADYFRGRIALLPHQAARHPGDQERPALPNDVYIGYPLGVPGDPVPHLRVNAGGPQIAGTPIWSSDSSGNGYHNNLQTRNSYAAVGSVDASVPGRHAVDHVLHGADRRADVAQPDLEHPGPVR